MIWVLIIVIGGGMHTSAATQEFSSERTCKRAAQIVIDSPGWIKGAWCVPK
jgi:hypothetical protein